MCADPNTLAAARSCCDADGNRIASYNYKFEYHGERISYSTNEAQCAADGLSVCDPIQVIAEAPLVSTSISHLYCVSVQVLKVFIYSLGHVQSSLQLPIPFSEYLLLD